MKVFVFSVPTSNDTKNALFEIFRNQKLRAWLFNKLYYNIMKSKRTQENVSTLVVTA